MNIFQASVKIEGIVKAVNDAYQGKQFRIVSNYNAQPYGRSRKSKKGQILTVDSIGFDDARVHIFPKEERLALGLNEVEFI